jgi:protein-tyrosine phosphatase
MKAHKAIALKRDEHYEMMQLSHPEWADRIDYWTVHDIDFLDPKHALPQIEAQVHRLVEEFKLRT